MATPKAFSALDVGIPQQPSPLASRGLVPAMSSKVSGWVWDQDLSVQRKCVLLWLAERATDNGVCFPGQHEIRRKTGLSESKVRRYLHWLASDQDELGQSKRAMVRVIERPIAGDRNTSNVYVVLVPWARPETWSANSRSWDTFLDRFCEGWGARMHPSR